MGDTACCDADVEEREKITESQRGAHRSSTLLRSASRSCALVANSVIVFGNAFGLDPAYLPSASLPNQRAPAPVGVLNHELASAESIHDVRSKDHGIAPGFAWPDLLNCKYGGRYRDVERGIGAVATAVLHDP